MNLEHTIQQLVEQALQQLYGLEIGQNPLQVQKTRKEFEGDMTVVLFPFIKLLRKSPEQIGKEIGDNLLKSSSVIEDYNVVKGYLNLKISVSYWLERLNEIFLQKDFWKVKLKENADLMMIEYSSPNTNKPLHLGHVRNNLLGWSIAQIQEANGWKVVKTNLVNDRGIHICKSMLAWKLFGNGETPQSSGLKGDHLVGKYYVLFDQAYKQQVRELVEEGWSEEEAKKSAPLMQEAQKMLLAWENNDPEVRKLWETMNGWVYEGFNETYRKLGIDFDKIYYESETYLVGKKIVEEGLGKGIFYRRPDGSVWADLRDDGLDEKLLLRADGTSVYMTQDIGTAKVRYDDFPIKKMVYVVGNEQNYHFQVLSILLDKLGFEWGKSLVHFSYGMVELPNGKMKSREGTVVDADDLIDEMLRTARETSEELGKLDGCSPEEVENIVRMVALGALKYFILKVDPRKNMTFNPKESIDFNGNTGPFIQYTHARIRSVLRKAQEQSISFGKLNNLNLSISQKERYLVQLLTEFPLMVKEAGDEFNPALIANFLYELVKEYNQFYHDYSILKEENTDLRNFRLVLSSAIADVIKDGMALLGIEVPERM
ncbi:MAG: arginine--tRNA ligase [Paludibacteraceae bacterium]|nr:arginine--tRNA ligase [Paludibacteraceae bacterium]MBP8966466.1 arginine--tRNA ligase [Paludibacteraceae bacterium]HOF97864.1 arginine--tRNA ligase [Paludibacteraceae bacterium]HOR38439.1 arginine--tRNA ligase [Paludibacteraceae bacterium]HQG67267.1 arginine--tRNA ligase [Paludibacteraceae bacterium]